MGNICSQQNIDDFEMPTQQSWIRPDGKKPFKKRRNESYIYYDKKYNDTDNKSKVYIYS